MEVILVKLISGDLVIGEKTETGIKYPMIAVIAGQSFGFFNYYNAMAKDKEASKNTEISDKMFMSPPVKPMADIEMKYREVKSGIKPGKLKLVDALGKDIHN